jgi:hypothetical protein
MKCSALAYVDMTKNIIVKTTGNHLSHTNELHNRQAKMVISEYVTHATTNTMVPPRRGNRKCHEISLFQEANEMLKCNIFLVTFWKKLSLNRKLSQTIFIFVKNFRENFHDNENCLRKLLRKWAFSQKLSRNQNCLRKLLRKRKFSRKNDAGIENALKYPNSKGQMKC